MAPLQFCTTSSRRYLAYARALSSSLARTNPASRLFVLLTDDHRHEVDRDAEPFQCVSNDELGFERAELHRMLLIHAPEYHLAIKPWIMAHVLRVTGGPVMFIDSDIQVYGDLSDLGELIDRHGSLLSPHAITPYPLDGKMPDDTTILGAGTFNAGMIGVGQRGRAMLDFLQSRLDRECHTDVARMRVAEQRWLDYLPSFMDAAPFVLRDPGVNAAYWNLHERPLSRGNGEVYAGDAPLRAYHFSGYDFDRPLELSRHAGGDQARVRLEHEPILAELCAAYRDAVQSCGNAAQSAMAVDFAELPGGVPIDASLRAVYRASVLLAERQGSPLPPDGYELAEREAFVKWAQWAYPAAGIVVPGWAAGPSLDEVVRRLVQTTSQAVAGIDARLSALEAELRTAAGASGPVFARALSNL